MPGLRNHVVILNNVSAANGSASGSGPSYTFTYDSGVDVYSDAKVGHYVYIETREAGDSGGDVESTYVYLITAVAQGGLEGGGDQITMKYLYDTAGTGDDSPADLNSGEGSSGSPENAPHDIVMVLGDALVGFVD